MKNGEKQLQFLERIKRFGPKELAARDQSAAGIAEHAYHSSRVEGVKADAERARRYAEQQGYGRE